MDNWKGTKGEWTITKTTDNRIQIGKPDVDIWVDLPSNGIPQKEAEANANLIASAPELLKALQESQKLLAELGTIKSGEAYYKNMKAINKALNGK